MALNNFGAAISSLLPVANEAAKKAHKDFYGTPRYFIERNLSIHRAFEQWCITQGLEKQSSEIRASLAKHIEAYQVSGVSVLEPLFKSIPNEFNIRGQWAPELQQTSL